MKKNIAKLFLLTCCLFLSNLSFGQGQNKIAKDITVQEFNRFISTKPGTILDVRTKGEVSKGVVKESVNIDFFDDDFESKVDKLDKTKPVYIYCASGGRSGEAMELMKKKGFTELYNLAGGYNAWIKDQQKKK